MSKVTTMLVTFSALATFAIGIVAQRPWDVLAIASRRCRERHGFRHVDVSVSEYTSPQRSQLMA